MTPRELEALMGTLSDEITPRRDLWDGIEAAILDEPTAVPDRGGRRWGLLVAVGVAAGVLLATWGGGRATPAPVVTSAPSFVVVAEWEPELRQSAEELRVAVHAAADPRLLSDLDESLAITDAAIDEVRRALLARPGDPVLMEQLAFVYEQRIALLRFAAEQVELDQARG